MTGDRAAVVAAIHSCCWLASFPHGDDHEIRINPLEARQRSPAEGAALKREFPGAASLTDLPPEFDAELFWQIEAAELLEKGDEIHRERVRLLPERKGAEKGDEFLGAGFRLGDKFTPPPLLKPVCLKQRDDRRVSLDVVVVECHF